MVFSTLALIGALSFGIAQQSQPGSSGTQADWKAQHDQIVSRLRAVSGKTAAFGPAYEKLYKVILPWYEAWGGRNNNPVDPWMVSPEVYASELADALEHGRNYIAEHLGSTFPAWYEQRLPGGRKFRANYLLHLPASFPAAGVKYPLTIGLPGSGWIAHKVSYGRGTDNTDTWISVTPILEAGDWRIDFLNAYIDELIRVLPVDTDKVYCSGHSLGAIATWNWALENPERFAAISPDDGFGQPYRAIRLKYVPVWAVHGERDMTFPPAMAEQMVSAVRAIGGIALYSELKGAPHNIPEWFNGQPITDWYLRNTRSHLKPPADPRDALKFDKQGFTEWKVVDVPAGMYWRSEPMTGDQGTDAGMRRREPIGLYIKAEGRGVIVDGTIVREYDPGAHASVFWLSVPLELQPSSKLDPSIVAVPASKAVRFCFTGTPRDAAKHLDAIQAKLPPGQRLSGRLWITTLGPAGTTRGKQIKECLVRIL